MCQSCWMHIKLLKSCYAKQKLFDYRDWPSKQLARVLLEKPSKQMTAPLKELSGGWTKNESQKLKIFQDYFQKLYTMDEVGITETERFLWGILIHRFTEDHISQ